MVRHLTRKQERELWLDAHKERIAFSSVVVGMTLFTGVVIGGGLIIHSYGIDPMAVFMPASGAALLALVVWKILRRRDE